MILARGSERRSGDRLSRYPDEPDPGLRLPSRTDLLLCIGRVIVVARIKLSIKIYQSESDAIEPPDLSQQITRIAGSSAK